MPRITTGTAKNKKLIVPNIENIRLVQDVYKLALFSIIGEKISNAHCLDLYAGSGSFGIEALSRGAEFCDFVDEHKRAIEAIQENLKNTQLSSKAEVHRDNATKYVANTHKKYDLIFVDPFYDDLKHRFLFKNLDEILNKKGLIAFSHGEALNVGEQIEGTNLTIETERKFGQSYLTVLKHQ